MNIFATSSDPLEAAIALDDKRVVKMVLESTQMLSTALFLNSGKILDGIYGPTHIKHPCTLWTSHSAENWQWLFAHTKALANEYTFRYGKIHKSTEILGKLWEYHIIYMPKNIGLTKFANCTRSIEKNIDFKNIENTEEAYRLYLSAKWLQDKRKPTWKNREKPIWFKEPSNLSYSEHA